MGKYKYPPVAIKIIEYSNEDEFDLIINKEVSLVKCLNHPNLISYYDHYITDTHVKLVLEYCKGGSLFDVIHNKKYFLSLKQKLNIIRDCASGILYLHNNSIIHRDIKSLNVLLVNELNDENSITIAKITGIGFSKTFISSKSMIIISNPGAALWMAPEVIRGNDYSLSSDIFSFGILIWEIFAQNFPYGNNHDPVKIAYQVAINKHRPNLNELLSHTPEDVKRLMISCWEEDPSKRPKILDVFETISKTILNFIK